MSMLHHRFSNERSGGGALNHLPLLFCKSVYYHDGQHLSHKGLIKLCGIILSNLCKVLSPSSYKKRHGTRSAHKSFRTCKQCFFSKIQSEIRPLSLQFTGFRLLGFAALKRTAQLYFKPLITSFGIFAISEHCLFEEQLNLLKSSTGHTYNCIAVSAFDNPPLLSGNKFHGGVAFLWKQGLNDYIIPLRLALDHTIYLADSFQF